MPEADRPVDDFDTWQNCDHDYAMDGLTFPTVVYQCAKCGDSFERDVS